MQTCVMYWVVRFPTCVSVWDREEDSMLVGAAGDSRAVSTLRFDTVL